MVTVIIPSYNRAQKVKVAVESVLAQTWSDLEVIVVDDGSSDNTREVLSTINDLRLRYVYQENAGACAARNHGISLAKGEYIAFHDSDDVWHPDKLQKQMEVFQNTDIDLVFCKLKKILSDESYVLSPMSIAAGVLNPVSTLIGIGTQTLVAKRYVFEEFRFDAAFPRLQEFELLYRIAQKYTLYCIDEGLVDYYVGDDSISSDPRKMYQACKLIMEKHPEMITKYPVMSAGMANLLLKAATQMRQRKMKQYKDCLNLAARCNMNLKQKVKAVFIAIGCYSKIKS